VGNAFSDKGVSAASVTGPKNPESRFGDGLLIGVEAVEGFESSDVLKYDPLDSGTSSSAGARILKE
jgi:hypothetical protein